MFRLGLTGSIATGKSTVLQNFAQLGAVTYSADEAVYALYRAEAVEPLEALFPGVSVNGEIDRALLATKLVNDPTRIEALEAIVHPLVRTKMQEFIAEAAHNDAKLIVLEIPLLFETGATYPIDAVAVTVCSEEEQKRRAFLRPGMNVDKFNTIVARQMPQAEKKLKADFVIDTNGSEEESKAQVARIIAACLKPAKESNS